MGDHAARGFVWLAGQTVLLRVITLVGQLVLAYYLTKEQFGDVGLALTVHAFATILQQGGINEILVQRQARLSRWSNPAFWMSLMLGLVSGGLVAASAPLAATIYNDPDVVPLLCVLAISMVPAALIMVPEAKLSAELRFRTLATVGLLSTTAQLGMSVVLAMLDFGAMSMVLPRPIVLTIQWIVIMILAKPRIVWRIQARRWRYLVSDNITLVIGKLCLTTTHQGDKIILGLFTTDRVVGLYYFAFNLSMQTMALATQSLTSVLFPVLSKLEDPVRQTKGFIQAARVLAVAGVPLCLLQAGVADPLVRAVFHPRWLDSIPILQLLSLGMALRLVGSPAGTLMYAQGRFRTVLILNTCYAVAFLSAVTVGAIVADGVGVAVGASIYFGILGPVHMYVAIRPGGGRWRDVWNVYAAPVAASIAAIAPSMWISEFVPEGPAQQWIRMAVIGFSSGALYLLLTRILAPAPLEELFRRFNRMPVVGSISTRIAAVMLLSRPAQAVESN